MLSLYFLVYANSELCFLFIVKLLILHRVLLIYCVSSHSSSVYGNFNGNFSLIFVHFNMSAVCLCM